jgi:hypothetical protein
LIPAGGEGKISVEVRTAGYGGREIRESVVVHTNDPATPVLELMVSGRVEVFADIQPKRLRFTARAGEPAAAVVKIVPHPDRPFKIKNVRAMNGRDIRFSLADETRDGRAVYELTVTSTRQDAGRFSDVIHLDTDSPIRTTIQIPVHGTIIEAKREKP